MLTLCKKYPNLEWSGYCLHTVTGDLFQEQVTIHGVYLMDVGSEGATDFKGNSDIATLLQENPSLNDLIFEKNYRFFQCKVHSHADMPVFHSQGKDADSGDLEDNSKNQDFYISLVVNNKMNFFAKICRWVKSQKLSKTVQVNRNGKFESYTYEIPERLEKIIQDVKVSVDMQNPQWFTDRLQEIKPVASKTIPQFTYYNGQPINTTMNAGWRGRVDNQIEIFEDEVTFEDEIKLVFNLPKKVDASEYLLSNKVDIGCMVTNLASYTAKEQDDFFDQLSEWIIENDLQESRFAAQLDKYLSYVEAGDNK